MFKGRLMLVVVMVLIAGAIFYFESQRVGRGGSLVGGDQGAALCQLVPGSSGECYKEISTPDGFINAENLALKDLVGDKVILVDFWTYTCINCQRTQPYLNDWYEKYKDQGLEIVGIHTPEFEFEKKYENVSAAVEKAGIKYPVVLDNDYSTWRAYKNNYWPRKYLIDMGGQIIYDHIGEGAYEETELKIKEALEERVKKMGEEGVIVGEVGMPEEVVISEGGKVGSPEIYFGAGRNEYLGNGKQGVAGVQNFNEPKTVELNKLYLVGSWEITPEYAKALSPNAKIVFKYRARNVYMVAASLNGSVLKIFNDGKKLADVNMNGDDLYALVKNEDYGERILEIQIPESGLMAFTFTFG